MYSCILYLIVVIFIIILFYYYIRVVNRDTYENETEETEKISSEFVNNINGFKTDLIKTYLNDMQIENRLKKLEEYIDQLKESESKEEEKKTKKKTDLKKKKKEIVETEENQTEENEKD